MRRAKSLVVYKMAVVAILSALGVILMLFVKIPYPPAPWCEIEISDLTIVVGYVLTGFPGALSIAVIKTLIHMLTMPTSAGSAVYIGDLAAILSSLLYLIGILVTSHVFRLFNKGLLFRVIGYVIIALFVSIVMTLLNYLFITPTYLVGAYTTCFNQDAVANVEQALQGAYPAIIFGVYIPFNLAKCSLILAIYEILFNTLIFRLLKNNKYFKAMATRKKIEEVEQENLDNQKKELHALINSDNDASNTENNSDINN